MTLAAFPSTLPPMEIPGYVRKPVDPVTRTEMDGGNTRSRRRFTAVPDMVSVTWRFTPAEYAIFVAWHHTTLLDGAAWFTINLVGIGGTIASMTAKFAGMYQATLLSGLHQEVSATLETQVAA
jgi:hypothetical protein